MEISTTVAEGKRSQDKLLHIFRNLEEKWESIKKTNPRIASSRILSERETLANTRSSSSSTKSLVITTLQLLQNDQTSPRNLMYSLQNNRELSSSKRESSWNVRRSSDMDVLEIVRERRAAIKSGKLKGRRLFDEPESENEEGFNRREENSSIMKDMVEKFDDDHDEGQEKGNSGNNRNNGKRWISNILGFDDVFVVIILILFITVIGLIMLIMRRFGRDGGEMNVLVPT